MKKQQAKVEKTNSLISLRNRLNKRQVVKERIITRQLKILKNEEMLRFSKRKEYLERIGEILKLRREHRKTLESIANFYGMSRQRVHQIIGDYNDTELDPIPTKKPKK